MQSQQTNVDNTANNLANANTTGYKQSRVVFQDLLYETVQEVDESESRDNSGAPSSLQIGHGATAVATVRSFNHGGFSKTGNTLDVAIEGDGFLQVRKPDGSISYTRDGTLTQDGNGRVTTQSGLPIVPEIVIPEDATRIEISKNGIVSAEFRSDENPMEIGQIELTRFSNPAGLDAKGGNMYEATQASGRPIIDTPGNAGLGTLRQGFLESSNVDVVKEMVNLISAQRAYEINSKMITTSEEMLQTANNLKR
jgi:flagellar basal-body rod protein FlgG